MSKHGPGVWDWSVPVPDTWERAAKITVPVLAVPGNLDSPDHITGAERLAGLAADDGTTVIEGAAHCPNMERRKPSSAVTEFL